MDPDQKSARSSNLSAIGGDIWVEIFKRLPVVNIGRSRCVCKEWNSVISSCLCIAAHHSFNASSAPPYRQPHIFGLHYNRYSLCRPQTFPLRDLFFPFRLRFGATRTPSFPNLVDVVNGVVCVSVSLSSSFDTTFLWNPTIRRYVAIPRLHRAVNEDEDKEEALCKRVRLFKSSAIGFGYHSSKNDFKVVRVWIPCCSSSGFRFEVYSYRQRLWRAGKAKTEALSDSGLKLCGFIVPAFGCFLNGTVHWLLTASNSDDQEDTYSFLLLLLMFDCEREDFRTMELPEELGVAVFRQGEGLIKALLSKYSGMLSVFVHSQRWRGEGDFELWAMNSEDRTWNKLFSFDVDIDVFVDFHYHVVMLSEDGDSLRRYSVMELASKGRNTTMTVNERFYRALNGYVYEESMFLTDDIEGGKGRSKYYAKDEVVDIQNILYPQTP